MKETHATAFRKLKPSCVTLSQVALQFKANKVSAKDVVRAVENLLQELEGVGSETDALDEKLADYVFFPLSYIFRDSKSLPPSAIETSLKCLYILITSGWRYHLGLDLSKQLLILLSYLAGGGTVDSKSYSVNEEVAAAAFQCLTVLLHLSEALHLSFNGALEHDSAPLMGHAVTVILAGITHGPSNQVQLAATRALDALVLARQPLANFLPGIVSSLTIVLQPVQRSRRAYRVMEGCLDILTNIISTVLGDSQEHVSLDLRPGNENSLKPDQAWMKATSVQIKLKLANVTRMRYHERPEVQEALFRMCMRILHDCRHSLSESASLMIETSIIICSQNIVDGAPAKISAIQKFVGADGVLLDALKASMHDWVVALPRVLQSNSELGKERSIAQISAAIEILTNLNVDFDSLDDTMASSLRESVTTIIDASSTKAITSAAEEGLETSMLLQATPSRNTPSDFASILSGGGSCDGLIGRLQKVVSIIGHSRSASSFKRRLVENIKIRNKSRDVDLASLWISFKLLDDTPYEVVEVDSYLSLPVDVQDTHQEFLEVVYSSCVEVLTDSAREDDSDWRLQALALEVLAFQSRQQRLAFRPELVEVLYPVVERMGSNNALLREHAMTCLNIMAKACQYISSADLVTNNVDYLVNAVALKFNTFDISPQAPRVLLMMVRLCGPALIPYLDDLVESIFSALACFHGYPRLVESMFATLSAIVDEGNQLSSSSIKAQPETVHRKLGHHHATISDVATLLKQMTVQSPPAGNPDIDLSSDDQQFDRPTETHGDKPEQDLQGRETSTSDEEVEKKAPSKTYAMVQSIARLGQHYLTHDSPSLRRQLLQLTRRACTALYRNEDEFLPLVNDLWPVVVKRLYDSEPFVSIAATEAVSQIFQSAGDFMASRVDAEWSDIHNLYWGVHLRLKADKKGNGRGEFTSAYQMWDALVKMLISMIEFVWISDEIEDDLVDMLGLYISTRSDVRKALLILNPDAVWLELERQRQVQGGESLKLPGMRGIIFRKVVL